MKKRKRAYIRKSGRSTRLPMKFVLIFLSGLFAGSVILSFIKGYYPQLVEKATSFTASFVGILLNLSGLSVQCRHQLVVLDRFSFEVIDQCLGAHEAFIFSAALIAYPTGSRNKLVGICLGVPFLYLVNVSRLALLGVVGRWSPGASDLMHLYLWQAVLFLTVLITCVLWVKTFVHRGRKSY